ncbi:Protein bfr2 [Taphrina deformans PYCC 5710]|uniref:Protein BFR2 n=1 Tax=Taphrina deformans (strain PYCC 5710 / ATCC 11124 / CBS 356.35 / IMI 108563 / JCM 9778 / NBRC 8474) TaxID=1097556 RepID=R4XBA0_TAPDE|nr:Protein bfr2 [Taphrina deformans PYCC 5710]|eukprot:CCG82880.1 Protein bfr2 [Taphrina deformans PYCC 5710]
MPSRVKRSSLADQLASLDNPNPVDIDPENAENYVSDGSGDEGSMDEGDDDGRSHYTTVEKSRLRDTELEKPSKAAYKGQKSSRKAIFETASDGSEDESDNSASDLNEESGSEGDMAAFDDFDREEEGFSDESSEPGEESISESGSGSDQSNLSEDEESDDASDDSEDERQAAEMKRLLASDQKAIVQDVVKTATADAEKGKAVKVQLGLYDSLLDSRIKLQKGLQSTNLATTESRSTALPVAMVADTEAAALDFIESLLTLRDELIVQDCAQAAPSRKRKYNDGAAVESSELWKAIRAQDDSVASWRDQTLTKWSNKIQAASGIDKTKKFKALSQGILAQIEESKSDRVKLLKRTQIKRFKASAKTIVSVEDLSTEIYDDGDFYQEMLKDLIDSRMLDSSNGNQMKWIATKQPKQKKGQVDTRASKGRKLRYHVHEKIQNFMAPMPTGSWHEEQVDELFGSLFGQTLQVNDENAEDDTGKNDSEVEAVEIGDDFKLFG